MADEKKHTVAYVPFRTFLAAIEGFERNMPDQIDSSVWPTYSGAIRSQLISALKFLGLIDDKGHPTPALRTLVEDKENRKAFFRKVLEVAYKPIFAIKLDKATPRLFNSTLEAAYSGMTGETQAKIKSFFLQAAKFAGVPMNQLLVQKTRTVGARRKKKSAESGDDGSQPPSLPTLSKENSKTVKLKSGVTLTITVTGNILQLSAEERDFVFGLNDQLDKFALGQ